MIPWQEGRTRPYGTLDLSPKSGIALDREENALQFRPSRTAKTTTNLDVDELVGCRKGIMSAKNLISETWFSPWLRVGRIRQDLSSRFRNTIVVRQV